MHCHNSQKILYNIVHIRAYFLLIHSEKFEQREKLWEIYCFYNFDLVEKNQQNLKP